jgi:hypothetical protein
MLILMQMSGTRVQVTVDVTKERKKLFVSGILE